MASSHGWFRSAISLSGYLNIMSGPDTVKMNYTGIIRSWSDSLYIDRFPQCSWCSHTCFPQWRLSSLYLYPWEVIFSYPMGPYCIPGYSDVHVQVWNSSGTTNLPRQISKIQYMLHSCTLNLFPQKLLSAIWCIFHYVQGQVFFFFRPWGNSSAEVSLIIISWKFHRNKSSENKIKYLRFVVISCTFIQNTVQLGESALQPFDAQNRPCGIQGPSPR